MWKKHRKELMGCVLAAIAIVCGLLGVVTLFEELGIHVAGSREMWMGLVGAVIGGMFTLIGVLITIYNKEEVEAENRRLENMPILGFEVGDNTTNTDSTLEYYDGEMITSGFSFLEDKICENIRIHVINNRSAFNFTIKECLINGKKIPLGKAFNPSKRRLVSGEDVNLVFNCDNPESNLFCIIRFSFDDIFGHTYYQDLSFTYAETTSYPLDFGRVRQLVEIRDIKPQMLVSKENKTIEEAAKEYDDYVFFVGKEVRTENTNKKVALTMSDKILQVKNEIRAIMKNKKLTRIQRYELVKEKRMMLSEDELQMLLKEYHRDYASYERFKDIKDIISMFMTAIGMFIALCGISFKGVEFGVDMYKMLVLYVIGYTSAAIMLVAFMQSYRSQNLNRIQYILDILETKEEV